MGWKTKGGCWEWWMDSGWWQSFLSSTLKSSTDSPTRISTKDLPWRSRNLRITRDDKHFSGPLWTPTKWIFGRCIHPLLLKRSLLSRLIVGVGTKTTPNIHVLYRLCYNNKGRCQNTCINNKKNCLVFEAGHEFVHLVQLITHGCG